MTYLTPGVTDVMACVSADGEACQARGAGHALHALQGRVTAATPGKWRDGLISHVSSGGWISVDLLDTGETAWLWNHADLTAAVTPGQPVAVHALYHALAVGRERINVLVASLG